jgi:hypothetical protein
MSEWWMTMAADDDEVKCVLEGLGGQPAAAAHVALRPRAVDEVLLRQVHQPTGPQRLLACSHVRAPTNTHV